MPIFKSSARGIIFRPTAFNYSKIDFFVFDAVENILYAIQISNTQEVRRHFRRSLSYLTGETRTAWISYLGRQDISERLRNQSLLIEASCKCTLGHGPSDSPQRLVTGDLQFIFVYMGPSFDDTQLDTSAHLWDDIFIAPFSHNNGFCTFL